MSEWHRVASASNVAANPGRMIGVEIGDKPVAIYSVDEKFYATSDICSHAFVLLSDGYLDEYEIECPLHAGRFDIRTGRPTCSPVSEPIASYPVKVEGDDIFVSLDA